MNRSLIAVFTLTIAGASTVDAQQTTGAERKAPLSHRVAFPEGDQAWEITFQDQPVPEELKQKIKEQNSAKKERGLERIKRIQVVREGKLRRDITYWKSGGTSELWWPENANAVFYEPAPGKDVRMKKTTRITARRLDESVFKWVSAKTFKDVVQLKGKDFAYYETESLPHDAGYTENPNDMKELHQAWIDLETNLPMGYAENGGKIATFNFLGPYVGPPLVLPEKVKEQIRKYQAYRKPLRWPTDE